MRYSRAKNFTKRKRYKRKVEKCIAGVPKIWRFLALEKNFDHCALTIPCVNQRNDAIFVIAFFYPISARSTIKRKFAVIQYDVARIKGLAA